MKQCTDCYRFLSNGVEWCPYCNNKNTRENITGEVLDEELINYKIFADKLIIKKDPFQIIDIIGQGSHGIVLKVKKCDGKYYAIKLPLMFNEQFSNNQGNRKSTLELSDRYITHEVNMLNRISSEALIEVIYAGPVYCSFGKTESEFAAILMELAEGSLKDIIDSEMANQLSVPFEERINMIKQLTVNIEKLHKKNIVHRDLSPHNVFIVDREKKINYVLADFGTSKPTMDYENKNSTTRMAFHDRYVDPAVFIYNNFRYDSRIDIYQLGVIITEILMGEFWKSDEEGTSTSDIRDVDFEKEFLLKYAINEINPELLSKLRKATTLNISERYRSASDFRKEIHDTLEKEQKKGIKIKPKNSVKKNIGVSFKKVLPLEENINTKQLYTIQYEGQKRIDMKIHDTVRIEFPKMKLKDAKIIGPSFLKCQKSDTLLLIKVDTDEIIKYIQPIFRPGFKTLLNNVGAILFKKKKNQKKHVRIEFDCKSMLYIEGALL